MNPDTRRSRYTKSVLVQYLRHFRRLRRASHVRCSGLKAGDWVREAAQACGGKGGGKPDKAQGGGTEPAKLPDAINAARAFASGILGSSAGV